MAKKRRKSARAADELAEALAHGWRAEEDIDDLLEAAYTHPTPLAVFEKALSLLSDEDAFYLKQLSLDAACSVERSVRLADGREGVADIDMFGFVLSGMEDEIDRFVSGESHLTDVARLFPSLGIAHAQSNIQICPVALDIGTACNLSPVFLRHLAGAFMHVLTPVKGSEAPDPRLPSRMLRETMDPPATGPAGKGDADTVHYVTRLIVGARLRVVTEDTYLQSGDFLDPSPLRPDMDGEDGDEEDADDWEARHFEQRAEAEESFKDAVAEIAGKAGLESVSCSGFGMWSDSLEILGMQQLAGMLSLEAAVEGRDMEESEDMQVHLAYDDICVNVMVTGSGLHLGPARAPAGMFYPDGLMHQWLEDSFESVVTHESVAAMMKATASHRPRMN